MTTAQVRLWGTLIGAVHWDTQQALGRFEYHPRFINSGIEVSPVMMPLSSQVYSFPLSKGSSFHGLPGLLADSLPDRFGHQLIDLWVTQQGLNVADFDPVARLCYVGQKGMGALEYEPSATTDADHAQPLDLSALVEFANQVLSERGQLKASLAVQERSRAMEQILKVGTSAGGARAKAIIAWNPETQEVRSGQVISDPAFSHWLIKFDGITDNRNNGELNQPQGFGLLEYAYHLMALACGIQMQECRILTEGTRNHFMTRRFDRTDTGAKLHMQSLCALGHFDFNQAASYSYEQAFMLMRQMGAKMADTEQLFRRMAFNIMARNQDDHTKNIAFLMDRSGQWRLSPAFDLTYSYNPEGLWTRQHQMALNGKRDKFELSDFLACSELISMRKGQAQQILEQVQKTVRNWPQFAEQAGVSSETTARITPAHRTQILA